MAADMNDQLSLQTLESLESRLSQIEYYVTGAPDIEDGEDAPESETSSMSPQERMQQLEHRLTALSTKNKAAGNILELHKKHPDLFPEDLHENEANAYTREEKYDIINSCATMFPSTASRLTSIKDSQIPSTETYAQLSGLGPKLALVELKQEHRLKQIADLRLRTAILFQRWAELSILAANDCWVEWQERLLEAEKIVRRHEVAKEQDKEPV